MDQRVGLVQRPLARPGVSQPKPTRPGGRWTARVHAAQGRPLRVGVQRGAAHGGHRPHDPRSARRRDRPRPPGPAPPDPPPDPPPPPSPPPTPPIPTPPPPR